MRKSILLTMQWWRWFLIAVFFLFSIVFAWLWKLYFWERIGEFSPIPIHLLGFIIIIFVTKFWIKRYKYQKVHENIHDPWNFWIFFIFRKKWPRQIRIIDFNISSPCRLCLNKKTLRRLHCISSSFQIKQIFKQLWSAPMVEDSLIYTAFLFHFSAVFFWFQI